MMLFWPDGCEPCAEGEGTKTIEIKKDWVYPFAISLYIILQYAC